MSYSVSPNSQQTFFDNVIPSLSSALFTADLKHNAPGSYDFGSIDDSKHTGSITYVDVDSSQGFWGFTGTGYAVGNGDFVDSSISTIADTGTTLLYAPDDLVTAYYSQVNGAHNDASVGGYVFPCDASLPDLTLGIGSYHAVVPGAYINFTPITSSVCFGGLQSGGGSLNIFGDVFLKSQFVVFDKTQDTPRLGFAPKST